MPQTARTLTVLAGAASIADDGTQWIEVIPTCDKARNGRWFFTITATDLATYAESIRAHAGLIPVDYDHDGADGGSTVAAGWFSGEAQVVSSGGTTPLGETQDHDSLWAVVKWTPQAVAEIRDGRFKRLSPEFTFENVDDKTGLLTKAKEIIASTLTNRPFFQQLAPVGSQGAVVWESAKGYCFLQDLVSSALNPAGGMDYRYWVMDVMPGAALVRESGSTKTWVAAFEVTDSGVQVAPASDWVEAKQEWVQAAEAALESTGRRPSTRREHDMDAKVLAKSLGLPEDATDEQISEAVKAAKVAADGAEALKAENDKLKADAGDDDRIGKLEATLATERKERVAEKQEAILAKAVDERRIDPAAKPVLAEQFGDNIDGLTALIATFPPKPTRAHGAGGGGKEDGAASDAVETAANEFETTNDAGRTVTAGEGELDLHVKAEKLLADRGKHEYTAAEYTAAYAEAERGTPVAA